ncbi:hypothetical protein [Arthrobacter sp. CJ23]|uniref:hypothetical protein n=1 Tax=Arthrobacter sp. CJ23 TaxID=2972479 RepID=UPI00215C5C95|nr:hypothetical protein [Arthrobacter sp. CJ23]UVJ37988.1 hypothetical protein NVV90_11995 [Arthrobacter sp. CJ23]
MDTTGTFPQLSFDDPLYQIADYSQLMKEKLEAPKCLIFKNAGFVWGALSAWDAGTLTVDTSSAASSQMSSPQPTFATAGSLSGTIKFTEPGIYRVQWLISPASEPSNSGYRIILSGTWPGSPTGAETYMGQATHMNSATYWESFVEAIVRVPTANLEIRMTGVQSNSTTNAARVRLTKLHGL